MKPLTRQDMRGKVCEDPTCPDGPGHLAQYSDIMNQCHPGAGFSPVFRHSDGTLFLNCEVCASAVLALQIAQGMVQ